VGSDGFSRATWCSSSSIEDHHPRQSAVFFEAAEFPFADLSACCAVCVQL